LHHWLIKSAIFGLPGYILKGIERELLRRHVTALQAEIFLVQLRRSSLEFRRSSEGERAGVIEKWEKLKAGMTQHGRK
jgi:sterol 3beta-glucosyltransferase